MKKSFALFLLFLSLSLFSSLFAQSFKFAVMSDSRGRFNGVNEPVLSALANHLVENNPDAKFLFFPGDMVNGSKTNPAQTVNQLHHWREVMSPVYNNPNMIWPKIWTTVGNHEVQHRDDEKNFKKIFNNVFMNGPEDELGLTYSFDYENVHFTIIDSDRWYYGDPDDTLDDRRDWHSIKHLDWVENDLKAARQRGVKWIFVISHETVFPTGGHLRDGLANLGLNFTLPLDSVKQNSLNQRNKFWEILKKYNAAAYFCGHEHVYSRQSIEGVYQIIAGSSGAPIYYFNPTFDEKRDTIIAGMEMLYEQSVPYYKVFNYNYGPGKNSQASDDFVGKRAFHYVTLNVEDDEVKVETYGAYVKEDNLSEMGSEIQLIDEFVIKRETEF
ncbi:MAG: metallophosphoesterase [Ignavibacteriaceae bacterium]|nr:metallophosphoesterase [Ignavibacteriaceae bacterium]